MKFRSLILVSATLLPFVSCVHRGFEYPSPEAPRIEVELELQYFDTDMPLHTVVDHGANRSEIGDSPASRHIIKVYDANRAEVDSAVLADEAGNATLPRRYGLSIVPGRYTAVCWTDYTDEDCADRYYDTSDFPTVELHCTAGDDGFMIHEGNTPWRDAYCGCRNFAVDGEGVITYDDNTYAESVLVEMRRPMARFIFEATDFEEFAERYGVASAEEGETTDLLPDYRIAFRYADYMPSVFSAYTDAPVDSRVGASFLGAPQPASTGSGAIELGSDFVFVHPLETSVRMTVEIYRTDTGEITARAGPFAVPLLRNRLTIVRGRFLTAQSGQGIVIDTGFDGNFNIKI